MTAGELRHRVTLMLPDGEGGWRDDVRLWAGVTGETGGLALVAGGIAARRRIEVMLRYRRNVLPGLRLRVEDVVYEILAVLDRRGHRRRLSCLCEAIEP